jgi:hypothetical protein
MFFGLLLSMLFGLTILSLNIENLIEQFLTIIFFFWENEAVYDLITKNLVAHRLRNRKTTIMYSLSLAYIIFVTIAFNNNTTSFRLNSFLMIDISQ